MAFSTRYRWLCVAALAAGLALRIFFVVTANPDTGDGPMYKELAHNWRTYRIYGLDLGCDLPTPVDIRMPGYPGFLAVVSILFGRGDLPPMLAQAGVDILTCLLAAVAAAWIVPLQLRNRVFLAALWLATLCPFIANYAGVPLTEVLATFWTAAAIAAFARAFAGGAPYTWQVRQRTFHLDPWAAGGFAVGIGTLVRPETPLLLVTLAIVLIWRWRRPRDWKRLLRVGLLTGAGLILPLLPWTIRNAITLHEFQPLAPRYAQLPSEYVAVGFSQWTGTWLDRYRDIYLTSWKLGDEKLIIADVPAKAFDSEDERQRVAKLFDEYNANGFNLSPQIDAQFAELARERTARHPFRTYVFVPFQRAITLWFRARVELTNYLGSYWPPVAAFHTDPADFCVTLLFGAIGIFYVALAMAGVWHAVARRKMLSPGQHWAIAFLVAYCIVRTVYFTHNDTPEPRYMLECFPAVFALGALVWWPARDDAPASKDVRPLTVPLLARDGS
jgi:4-amino-4-deoxy-L-arabinose transferase-like glycosyltransferase